MPLGIVYHGTEPSENWYGQQAVYRVSLGNFVSPFAASASVEGYVCPQSSPKTKLLCQVSLAAQLFFGLLALVLLGVNYKGDKRDQYLQHGGWLVKALLWLLCNIVPFFLPASVVNTYGEVHSSARLAE